MESNTALHPLKEQQPTTATGNPSNPHNNHWLEGAHALMVVAMLLAGFVLKAGLNPPGGFLRKPYFDGKNFHEQGLALLAVTDPVAYTRFYIFLTPALLALLTVVLLSVSGLPFFNRRDHVWVPRAIICATLICLPLMQYIAVQAFTPIYFHGPNQEIQMIFYGIITWCVIMSLVLLAFIVRVFNMCWFKSLLSRAPNYTRF